jgi:hypothetical protein
MMIKQSAPFGSHSCKGLAAKAPPVVSNGSPSCWRSPTKRDKSNDGNQGSPSHRGNRKKAATVTTAPPVVGRVGRWRQGLSRKLETAPPVVGGVVRRDEQKQKTAPVVGNGSNNHRQSQTKAAMSRTAPPVVGRDKQRWRRITRSLVENNSGDGNNTSPSCWRRRTWWQWVHQLSAGMDGGNPKCVLARTATAMVTTAPPVVG